MRTYPTDSPQAAARILTLMLMADGNVCRSELDALNGLNAEATLKLPEGELRRVLGGLCEDLLTGLCMTGSMLSCLDEASLKSLMSEVRDRELQLKVIMLAQAAAAADGHVADSESLVMRAAVQHWGLSSDLLKDRRVVLEPM
jgi:uncharacterized tellurite resistance protein B-like protein